MIDEAMVKEAQRGLMEEWKAYVWIREDGEQMVTMPVLKMIKELGQYRHRDEINEFFKLLRSKFDFNDEIHTSTVLQEIDNVVEEAFI